jgi:hypothetical protein
MNLIEPFAAQTGESIDSAWLPWSPRTAVWRSARCDVMSAEPAAEAAWRRFTPGELRVFAQGLQMQKRQIAID